MYSLGSYIGDELLDSNQDGVLEIASGTKFDGNIVPYKNLTYDIGTSSFNWLNAYLYNLYSHTIDSDKYTSEGWNDNNTYISQIDGDGTIVKSTINIPLIQSQLGTFGNGVDNSSSVTMRVTKFGYNINLFLTQDFTIHTTDTSTALTFSTPIASDFRPPHTIYFDIRVKNTTAGTYSNDLLTISNTGVMSLTKFDGTIYSSSSYYIYSKGFSWNNTET